ncbi:MAG: ribosome small subunit-dependent GTPase A [Firmicutes bacterium]|nr:ribosome small subunit-dependent GTPase A [Bacillota bacterium]
MQEALVLKGYGGFYTLLDADGTQLICKTRGKLRKENGDILVGDRVLFSRMNEPQDDMSEGIIEEILPRKNSLIRPKLANIDSAILLIAAQKPVPDWLLLDKMLLIAELNNIEPLICLNKTDLLNEDEYAELENQLAEYEKAGFSCFMLSVKQNKGIDELRQKLKSGVCFLAGNSGVGKSTLTNLILGDDTMEVGEVGERISRGKHTTRHNEIIPLSDDILWADTPGFSLLDIPEEIDEYELASFYPEFENVGKCRFDGCLHFKEPDCAVRQAVRDGEIGRNRYLRYKELLQQIKEREVKY